MHSGLDGILRCNLAGVRDLSAVTQILHCQLLLEKHIRCNIIIFKTFIVIHSTTSGTCHKYSPLKPNNPTYLISSSRIVNGRSKYKYRESFPKSGSFYPILPEKRETRIEKRETSRPKKQFVDHKAIFRSYKTIDMAELDNLIRQRASVKSKLTIFSKFISNLNTTYPDGVITAGHAIVELEQRLERAQDLINIFDDIQGQIENICENLDQQYLEQENFQTSFFAIISKAKYLLTKNTLQPQPSLSSEGPSIRPLTYTDEHKKQNIKLPTIQLKKFHGHYEEWLEFRDTFESLIHKNEDITNIQKFHYLRASLEGGASQIIQSLEFSSENYDIAWKLICDRYNNPRILVNNHVKALFNLENIREESPKLLRKMIDNVTKHLRALQTLKEPTEKWDTLIIYLVTTKLDPTTAREWEETKSTLETPTLDDLKSFLKKSFRSTRITCPDFIKLNVQERLEQVKRVKACINCLRPGHTIKECRASFCKHCKRKHNSMLHFETREASAETDIETEGQSQAVCLTARDVHNSQVILATAQIYIRDKNNKQYLVRVLLDAGSQSSFINKELCNRLKLPVSNVDIQVSGLNQACASIELKTIANIKSRINNFNMLVTCLVVPQITNELPNFKIDSNTLNIPQHIKLADPAFNVPNKIDLLLGADCFWELLCIGQLRLKHVGPILQKTRFGWIISGCVPTPQIRTIQCNLNIEQQIHSQLERFWTVEEIAQVRTLSREERECESHFLQNTKRNSDGRFVVTIPLKDSPNKLGDSYTTAKKPNIIKNDFYVDDLLSGADKIEDAIQIANDVSRELQKGCFKLRKWVSNSPEILQGIETNDTSNIVNFGADESTKTLGLIWNGRTDTLSYNINYESNKHITKRTILSETSQIFDPLGLLSPCIITPKLILQMLWHEGLSWDEALPAHIHANPKERRNSGPLTSQEIQAASLRLVKLSQYQMFPREIEILTDKGSVVPKDKLSKLNPFLDQNKIIRLAGVRDLSAVTQILHCQLLLEKTHTLQYNHFQNVYCYSFYNKWNLPQIQSIEAKQPNNVS
ncbi:hypothetical protein NQ317_005319 [Molorchus minor]|uniref:Peptidase aspartic putative domain-containing protein n=1 Tax=Molorchus minor TaxID=1323400 RepID=A0ABQ9JY01_9CUCU|nr:hypothetical protein NQ317_005319 [Molorchus minor]